MWLPTLLFGFIITACLVAIIGQVVSRGRASSYHGIVPGSIPSDGRKCGLIVDPADIVMNR